MAAPVRVQGTLLSYYDKLPGKHFASFGSVNRRSLLKRKGAVVDYKRKFIEILGSAEGNGDLEKLQISLLPNGKQPWIAVNRIVWAQERTPGTLNFYYGYNDADGLREASSDFFPYKLKKRGYMYENAYLPRARLTVSIDVPDFHSLNYNFKYNPKFKVGQNAFERIADTRDDD